MVRERRISSSGRLGKLSADAVPSAKVHQRRAFTQCDFQHLRHKNRVIARRIGGSDSAIKISQRVLQYRGPARQLAVLNTQSVRRVGIALGIGKELRQRFLGFFQDADAELTTLCRCR